MNITIKSYILVNYWFVVVDVVNLTNVTEDDVNDEDIYVNKKTVI
jgi:hypothetical protein